MAELRISEYSGGSRGPTDQIEEKIASVAPPWWTPPQISIAGTASEATKHHDRIQQQSKNDPKHLLMYSDACAIVLTTPFASILLQYSISPRIVCCVFCKATVMATSAEVETGFGFRSWNLVSLPSRQFQVKAKRFGWSICRGQP